MNESLPDWVRSRQHPTSEEQVPADERMTPMEMKVVREALGFSREDLAASLGVAVRSIDDWETGRRSIPDGVRTDIERMEAYTAEVAEQLAGHLLEHGGEDPVFEVYFRDADMPALQMPNAPLTPTAKWWRAVAYLVAEAVPGLRIVAAPPARR